MTDTIYDLIIIGGGINGLGIAADAAGRGLSVLLCEQADLSSGTSSSSSKLIHGGLRYLEQYQFSLVAQSMREKKILLNTAPHLVRPLPFIIPYAKCQRPFWLLYLGVAGYQLLHGKLRLPELRYFDEKANPLKPNFKKGLLYYDADTEDARLCIATALRAKEKGATLCTRTEVKCASRTPPFWTVSIFDKKKQQPTTLLCKALVNATGPWINQVNQTILQFKSRYSARLVKGSHILVPALYPQREAYVLQTDDQRILFTLPYSGKYTIIGTSDVPYTGKIEKVSINDEEIDYFCKTINTYFHTTLSPRKILYAWSGVRALAQKADASSTTPSAHTREYKIEWNSLANHNLPLINIFGGKLTTYRHLAEQVVNQIAPLFPHCNTAPWTATHTLPGGDFPLPITSFIQQLHVQYPTLPSALLQRLAHNYGSNTYCILSKVEHIKDLGTHFGHGLYEKEVLYLVEKEWAFSAEDILWRRTKLGLEYQPHQTANLQKWLDQLHT